MGAELVDIAVVVMPAIAASSDEDLDLERRAELLSQIDMFRHAVLSRPDDRLDVGCFEAVFKIVYQKLRCCRDRDRAEFIEADKSIPELVMTLQDQHNAIASAYSCASEYIRHPVAVLFYIRQNIIKPFTQITNLPYELSKGNLTIPLKESKNRFFGKFLWGLDMLREKLEESKRAEIELKKEKKTMLLSLSHDIKTPLSAIKLYAKALSNGIYKEHQKRQEVYESINTKTDEIEKLVSEIMRNETEDIIVFDIKNGEFYLSEAINNIKAYYSDKLENTAFSIAKFSDCIINGDCDRLVEVLQNIMENAIKYGDGNSINLSFSDEEDFRIITIKNSGCTLDESELAHIFDSFYRGSNVGSKTGNGLGLYICRQLTKAMGGDVFADIDNGFMSVSVVCKKK